jgi:hypothetical protein
VPRNVFDQTSTLPRFHSVSSLRPCLSPTTSWCSVSVRPKFCDTPVKRVVVPNPLLCSLLTCEAHWLPLSTCALFVAYAEMESLLELLRLLASDYRLTHSIWSTCTIVITPVNELTQHFKMHLLPALRTITVSIRMPSDLASRTDFFLVLTLGDEVRFIWRKKLTRARALFWMVRTINFGFLHRRNTCRFYRIDTGRKSYLLLHYSPVNLCWIEYLLPMAYRIINSM